MSVRDLVIVVVYCQMAAVAADNARHVALKPGLSLKTLSQNWTDDEANKFYNAAQGSRLLPYDWFLHLEQPNSATAFRDAEHIRSLGYLPRTKGEGDTDGLPIGFIKDASYEDDTPGLGLTCAACHTSQINHNGTAFLIDGGPAMGDFERLMTELTLALKNTAVIDQKFARFAAHVLPGNPSEDVKQNLRATLRSIADQRSGYNSRNLPADSAHRFGPGRVDAFGAIFNEVAVTFLDEPANWHPANAPVSYPCLWDAPQHKRIQWNGAAENKTSPLGSVLFGTQDVGALGRNAGEVLGVFGHIDVNQHELLIPRRYESTVNRKNLIDIETSLRSLWSPEWPEAELGMFDNDMVTRGAAVYKTSCIECHSVIERTKEDRVVGEKIADAQTDQTLLMNFGHDAATGRLRGRRKTLLGKERFSERAPIGVLLKHLVERAILDPSLKPNAVRNALAGVNFTNPLDGIDSLNPGYRMTAVIEIGERKLVGQFDSLQQTGSRVKIAGGAFHLMDRLRNVHTEGLGDHRIELRSEEAVQKAAAALESVISLDTTEAVAGPDDPTAATVNNAIAVIGYKARPLNGIWATAPYLHNGSVPTLVELLKPAEDRAKTFHVGIQEFDPVNVGFKDDPTQPLYDTTVEGNSNKGHEYGVDLSEDDRRDLLEYLKSL
jgi:hypothetical protein